MSAETEAEGFEILAQFARDLERKWLETRHREKARTWKPTATAATALGWECHRRIAYQRLLPWAAEPISEELASIFAEGDAAEASAIAELERLGYQLVNRKTNFRDARLDIVGQTDAEFIVAGLKQRVPFEFKALSFVPGDAESGEDMAMSEKSLHRRYFAQLMIYLYLRSAPLGLFGLKSKATGRLLVIPVAFDYGRTEELLKKAEHVRDAVKAYVSAFESVRPFTQDGPETAWTPGDLRLADDWTAAMAAAEPTLPQRLADRSECKQCPWLKTCNPSQAPVDPALLIQDQRLIEMLERREETKAPRGVYEKNHGWIKERFEHTAGSVWFAGAFRIERKPHGKFTRLDITKQEQETPNDDD